MLPPILTPTPTPGPPPPDPHTWRQIEEFLVGRSNSRSIVRLSAVQLTLFHLPPLPPPLPRRRIEGAAHRIVEVAFCCAPLSRAVDAFSLLSAVQDSSWMQSFIVHQQAENNAARITLFSVEMLPTTEEEYSLMSPTGSTTDQLNPHVRLRYPSQKLRNPRYQRARRGDCVSKLSPAEADRIPCSFSPCAQCNRAGQHVIQRTPICSVCGDDQLEERAAHAQC